MEELPEERPPGSGSRGAEPRREGDLFDVAILPVRGTVLFPNTMMPLNVSRQISLDALDGGEGEQSTIAVVGQRDPEQEDPKVQDLHAFGCLARVQRRLALPSDQGHTLIVAEGIERIRVVEPVGDAPYLKARAERLKDIVPRPKDAEFIALGRNVRDLFVEIVQASPTLPEELLAVVAAIDDEGYLADWVAWSIPSMSPTLRQELLETLDVRARLQRIVEELIRVREDQRLQLKIRDEVQERVTEDQRRFLLREHLKAIRKELGEGEDGEEEITELRYSLEEAGLPDHAKQQADRELRRLERIPAESHEYTVARGYLDWLANLPWSRRSEERMDLRRAAAILDEDHFGLEKVKERILEHLAVYELKRDLRGPILCFVGPPGVGKTSLGRSIARAMGREFVRLSLGGVHDEAEIRGHRRTYVGALPGQILQGIRRAGTRDPVFMLDEIDKVGRDFRGDPAAALLEVLDPEQNSTFRDHYLEVSFDLSQVLFITTANVLDTIAGPLLDRMEVLEIPGYIDEEKLQIAKHYLVPRQLERHGLDSDKDLAFTDEGISTIMRGYTREAGVRKLEQQIAAICRKRAKQIVEEPSGERLVVDAPVVRQLLGAERFKAEAELEERTRQPGVAVGVAWTAAGGEILFVETTRMPGGKGSFVITGQVREVMQESARAAFSWVRSHAAEYGIASDAFKDVDVHIHIPQGAVPKDGPSAGAVMVAALVSLFSGRSVRAKVAMTGEITLSGLVLPVGGIKEKVLAAQRNGIAEMVLPMDNEPDLLEDVPEHLREGMEFHFVSTLREALDYVLPPRPNGARRAPRRPRDRGDLGAELH